MNENLFDKIKAFAKSNPLILIAIAAAAILLFFPKLLKGRVTRRRRRGVIRSYATRIRRRVTRRRYTRGGKTKKPWQIKGSLAARRHMARIRARR